MLNRVIIMGRLVSDPDFRQTTNGVPFCRIRVAVNRPYRKDQEQSADFIGCTAWRAHAEFISRYFTKGQMILIEGQLRNNDYTDKDGVKHFSMDVLIDQVQFGESKKQDGEQQTQPRQQAARPQQQQQPAQAPQRSTAQPHPVQPTIDDLSEFEEILSDGEVPF